jgi:TolA-binding protein
MYNPTLQLQNKDGINKLMAGSYFKQDAFDKALFYYKKFLELSDINQLNETDQYQMGYCYYQSADYANAQKCFEKLSEKSDSYAQYSLYTLADCFLRQGDKQAARNSFYKASKISGGNAQILEEASLNYAILSYELDYHLVALSSVKQFIADFPASNRINDAKGLLTQMLLTTKNYKDALEVCEGMTSRTEKINGVYQKVLYYRGVELYNANFVEDARKLFVRSLTVPSDLKIKALANYWLGEIAYDRKDYEVALDQYREFFNNSFCIQTDVYAMAHYSMAYAFYRSNKYNEAIYYFTKYIESTGENIKWAKDATLRIGDINFQIKDYPKAIQAYDKIINNAYIGSEYALFQKGIIQGILDEQNEKVSTLKKLLNTYPDGDYSDDAQFEIGGAYLTGKNYYNATYEFEKLLRSYPNSSYTSKALLNLGLIAYNESKDDSAVHYYKRVVDEYPHSDEAQEALLSIKNIFVDKGNADEFLKYSKTVKIASISAEAQDSISYKAANNQYLKGNCEIAIKSYANYIANFPNGKYIMDAYFERAECAYRQKEFSIAKEDLNYVMKGERNKYFEKAAYYQAVIAQSNKDTAQFVYYLQELENYAEYKGNIAFALTNLMQIFHEQHKDTIAFQYAGKVMRFDKSSSADVYNAKLVKAAYYIANGDTTLAELNYKEVADSTKTLPGVKAKFALAEIQFKQRAFMKSKETCFDIINNAPNYEYWIARAYILLAKNYYSLKNNFQAKSTLQSIIDNYQNEDDIISRAKAELSLIIETEQLQNQRKEDKEMLMIEEMNSNGNNK